MHPSTLPYYVVASSKQWHRAGFEALVAERKGEWAWASTPAELNDLVGSRAPRYIFFLHWNWIVPAQMWSSIECVCFHMTDVPYGRGGSPLQNLIEAGHTETKLTALQMAQELDAGPVYAKRPLSLEGRAEDIYIRAGNLSFDIIRWMIEAHPTPEAQAGEVTTFKRRRPEQSALPQEADLATLFNHIRMLDAPSYPPAFIDHGEFRIEFTHASLQQDALQAQVVIRKRTLPAKD
jgi:methionyl-tRNA formyltransferase